MVRITIPKTFMGIPVSRETLEKVLASKPDSQSATGNAQAVQPVASKANIKPEDYIQVGINGLNGKEVLISKFEFPNANHKDYEDAHKFVLQQGLYVPTPRIFMNHFQRVVNAYENKDNNSKPILFDGKGNPIMGKELEEIYLHLVKDHIASYSGGAKGAWSWLNGRFVKGSGFNELDLETITGLDGQGNLTTQKAPLETCEWSDSYVNLDFNSQGLAKSKAQSQEYAQGKNIKFYYPRQDCVAWFYADSGWADLYCYGDPTFTDAGLGVFACAEGAIVAKN